MAFFGEFDIDKYINNVIICIIRCGCLFIASYRFGLWVISLANLLLDLKFTLFFRPFHFFGVYYAIILGVAKNVFSFLLILFLIVLSFSHALFIILKPTGIYSLDVPSFGTADPNNPWNLVDQYYTFTDNEYNQNTFISKKPDNKVNMFINFHSSLLAMYNFLTGE